MSDLDDLLNSLDQPQAAPLSHGSDKYGAKGRSTQVPRSEIDALLGELDDGPAPAPAPVKANVRVQSVKPGGDNFDLDSMMAELEGGSPAPAAKTAPAAKAAPAPRQKSVAIKPMSGNTDDLDDVLNELGAISGPRQSVMKPKAKQSVTSEVRKERGKTMAALDDILSSLPGEEPGLDPNANFAPSVAPIQYQTGAPRRAVETSYTATCADSV